MAVFNDLCLDVTDPRQVVPFWSAALGLSAEYGDHGGAVLRGTESGQTIWVNPVPEPRFAKNRVHLDLHAGGVEALTALGATVLPGQDEADRWTVLADPEGNELCAFPRAPEEVPAYPAFELVVDCVDPDVIGAWWADVFGVPLQVDPAKPWRWLEGVPGLPFSSWVFNPVPEPKTVKNRLHWDVGGDVADFEARGASRLQDLPGWAVLADPEGNEFCVFPES